jgi:hypothetical protein
MKGQHYPARARASLRQRRPNARLKVLLLRWRKSLPKIQDAATTHMHSCSELIGRSVPRHRSSRRQADDRTLPIQIRCCACPGCIRSNLPHVNQYGLRARTGRFLHFVPHSLDRGSVICLLRESSPRDPATRGDAHDEIALQSRMPSLGHTSYPRYGAQAHVSPAPFRTALLRLPGSKKG